MAVADIPSILELRPYQSDAVDSIIDADERGIQRQLVALPTGSGKTVVFSHLIKNRPGRTLVLAHREELLWQTVEKITVVDPTADVGLVRAEANEINRQIVVSSIQTLCRPRRLAQFNVDNLRTVVVDEAHHSTARTYGEVLEHVGAFRPGGPLTIGFTATVDRGDGVDLNSVYQEIVYRKTLIEMIDAGYLSDLRAIQVKLAIDLRSLHVRAGDFIASEVEDAMFEAHAPEDIAKAYIKHARDRKGIVFVSTVRLAHAVAQVFHEWNITAEALDGTTDRETRRLMLQRLRFGETQVVCNCAVLTEGFDEPSVDCIVIARPTRSILLYMQMIGRGSRLYPGKEECLILDLVGSTTRHDLMTLASTFGLSEGALEDQTLSEAIAEKTRSEFEKEQKALHGTLVSRQIELFQRRKFPWINAGDEWVINMFSAGSVRLIPEAEDRWRVVLEEQSGENQTVRLLSSGLDLGYAMGVGEDHVRAAGFERTLDREAPWRNLPATDKQLAALRALHIQVSPRLDLTRGKATDLITQRKATRRSAWMK